MAILLAIAPKDKHFKESVLSDIESAVYDAAVMIDAETNKPYALLSILSQSQIDMARNASMNRREPFYRERAFNPQEALDPKFFEKPCLFVDRSKKPAIALGSLDCHAFFNLSFTNSSVWTEKLDVPYTLQLKSKFMRALKANQTPENFEVRDAVATSSLYLKAYAGLHY